MSNQNPALKFGNPARMSKQMYEIFQWMAKS